MARQVLGSILVALAIVIVTIAIVTAKLGRNAEDGHGGGGKTQQEDHRGKVGG
jgi:hypothetical protein